MKIALGITAVLLLCSCAVNKPHEATYNERMLEYQKMRLAAGEDIYGENEAQTTSDPVQSSLWAKSVGSPYIIRNQKAQKIGDLLTIVVDETAEASTTAKTDAKKESKLSAGGGLSFGQGALEQVGSVSGTSDYTNEQKGSGTTDRSGKFQATVQAVVESVLPNGTLFVRGRKNIMINNEDQEVEISGFVRPDDIKINNTVISSMMADAEIRYLGKGTISDKQRAGWGSRFLDWVWPF
ncbi:MAG: flagellar biosynthesis protein FlgH [Deltaproteobacteria bacterium CG11_big_fil_rev_8_21_14_0_20_45_16]|nr:MAG: flagellar biosynthesis protein FlgH [Deltaproteobacteria bacterium CG11_big_fil_rev_8_21_14_0_20_45_16]